LTTGDLMEELKIDLPMVSLQWIAADVDAAAPRGVTGHQVRPDHLAFLQYTSGSTSSPKGVMVDHRNLMANQEVMYQAFEHTPGSTIVGWAPLFHDQGLIGNFLHPLFAGTSCVLMAPFSFIKRP
jgi:acyl-CoA synthetase (AMP-forming)/AMP-acid ligase II